ncbi:hypothetical protein JL722_8396 [Aureococcus anophagefferens]|nr:hypothetical protein JL722_8396 [Aureococcus anophagefferens]
MGFRPIVDPEEAMDMSVPVGFLSSTWQHPDLGYRRPASTAARFAATNYERALELSRSAPGLTIGFSMADTDPDEHRRARHRTAPVITTSLRDVLRQRKSLLKGADVPVFRDAAQSWADYAAADADESSGRVVVVPGSGAVVAEPGAPREPDGDDATSGDDRDDDDDDGAPRSARRSRAGVGKARERSMVGGYRTVKEMRDAGEKKSAVDARQTMVHEAIEDHATVAQRRAVAERLYNKKKAREQRATTMLVKEKRHESAARELAALKDRQAAARAEHKKVKLRQQYVAARYKGAASVEAKAQMLRALSAHMAHQKKRKDARERSREPEIVEKVIKNRDGMGYRKQSVVAGAADGAALPGIADVAPPTLRRVRGAPGPAGERRRRRPVAAARAAPERGAREVAELTGARPPAEPDLSLSVDSPGPGSPGARAAPSPARARHSMRRGASDAPSPRRTSAQTPPGPRPSSPAARPAHGAAEPPCSSTSGCP